jgi:hypothetical protein
MAGVLTILLIGGLINMSSCYSNLESSATQKLANDPELRDKIANKVSGTVQSNIEKMEGNLKEAQEKFEVINERAKEMEKESARATSTFTYDIQAIRFMLSRISEELKREPPSEQSTQTRGKNNKR